MNNTKKIVQRAKRHSVVLFFVAIIFCFFVLEARLPLWLALLGFAVIFASSLVYLETPLPISSARRKRAKAQPHALRADAANLLPYATLLLDTQGTIKLANKAALKLFGDKSADEKDNPLRGRTLSAVLREPSILAAFDACVQNGEMHYVEWKMQVPVPRFFSVVLSPNLAPKDDAKPFVLLSFSDQTDIQLADQMKSDFIANASHELKTPLSVLIGGLEALRTLPPDNKEQKNKFLSMMEQQSTRMVQLVEDLMSLSRIEQKEHRLPEDKVSLAGIIEEAIATNQSVCENIGLKIKFEKPEGELSVIGSHKELSQAFGNLIHNALTHGSVRADAPKEIIVAIESAADEKSWQVHIKDYGKGIAQHHIPRLTERFYRIDPEESRKLGGTGLGLAIVKHIITRHRGTLSIQSAQGVGSTFSVLLGKATLS